MGVFTRPDSKYYQLFLEGAGPNGKGRKEKTRIRVDAPLPAQKRENRQLAEQLYHARMTALARGEVEKDQKPRITFAAFAAWFRTHNLPHRKGKERDTGILDRLVEVFGTYELQAITRTLVSERWITPRLTTPTVIAKKKRTAARTIQAGPSTINREVDLLKAVLSAAVPDYLEVSPLYGMKRLKTPTPQRRVMTEDEERRLLAVMTPEERAFFLIGIDSLVRLTDILDLEWSHDRGATLWIADPKAGGGFAVPLSTRARLELDQVAKVNGSPYIFARLRQAETERDRRARIRRMLAKCCAAANIDYGRAKGGLTFHWATRRTGATRMLTRGVDIGTVQKVGRWKTADLVLGIYHELLDDKARAAVESVAGGAPHSQPVPKRTRSPRRRDRIGRKKHRAA